MTLLAVSSWPEAAVWIAGIAFLGIVLSVALWQIFGTGKAAVQSQQDQEYRKLVDELSAVQRETTAELQQTNAALSHLRGQIEELGQSVSEVDRVLKTVE